MRNRDQIEDTKQIKKNERNRGGGGGNEKVEGRGEHGSKNGETERRSEGGHRGIRTAGSAKASEVTESCWSDETDSCVRQANGSLN